MKKSTQTLSPEALDWFNRLRDAYGIDDDAGLLLLQTATECFDRMRQCQTAIDSDGATILDRFGQTKAHPLLATERDARAQMLAALTKLNLDLEPLRNAPGRPSRGPGWQPKEMRNAN